uniref:Uncharacterized protein n=1 Tax=Knipowitschia caucasica TaxID=637954 RepID=A0AAV2L5L1_KNICA
MSVPVYSSRRKNWFHIQPLLDLRRGAPFASCAVSAPRPRDLPSEEALLGPDRSPAPEELQQSSTRPSSTSRSMVSSNPHQCSLTPSARSTSQILHWT